MIVGCPTCQLKPAALAMLVVLYSSYLEKMANPGRLALHAGTLFDVAVEAVAAQSGRSMGDVARLTKEAWENA